MSLLRTLVACAAALSLGGCCTLWRAWCDPEPEPEGPLVRRFVPEERLPGVRSRLPPGTVNMPSLPTGIPWPYEPSDVVHALGSNYGQFQNYLDVFGDPSVYWHTGIDVLSGVNERPVYAVEDGTITKVWSGADPYRGCIVGSPTSEGEGWAYVHIVPTFTPFVVGEPVSAGDQLGVVAEYTPLPTTDFDHVHFGDVQGPATGFTSDWGNAYAYVGNPLAQLAPNGDEEAPEFVADAAGDVISVRVNGTGVPADPADLEGDVDVLVGVRDRFESAAGWGLVPYELSLDVQDPSTGASIGPPFPIGLQLDGYLADFVTDYASMPTTLYDAEISQGNELDRRYFFVLTHVQTPAGGPWAKPWTPNGKWDTTSVPNGPYTLVAEVQDHAGNQISTSRTVTVGN